MTKILNIKVIEPYKAREKRREAILLPKAHTIDHVGDPRLPVKGGGVYQVALNFLCKLRWNIVFL